MMFGLMSALGLLTAASGTVVRAATDEAALEDYTFEEVSCMNKTVSYGVGTEKGWETCSVGQPQGLSFSRVYRSGNQRRAAADSKTWAAFCDSKVVYSKKFKRFVKCQSQEWVKNASVTNACTTALEDYEEDLDLKRVEVCKLEAGSDVHGHVAGVQLAARTACTAALCEMAKTGSWKGWTSAERRKGQTAAWPRHVDGFNSWGWRHSARQRCKTEYAGYTIIDVESLYEHFDDHGNAKGHLVKGGPVSTQKTSAAAAAAALFGGAQPAANPIFDKTKCGCSTDSTCP